MGDYVNMGALYFIGFGAGIVFMFLPDRLGRYGTMAFILPLYACAAAMCVFFDDLQTKRIGFFLQGFLHIKIANSFLHIFELVPEDGKVLASTVITSFDSSSMAFVCGLIKFGGLSF